MLPRSGLCVFIFAAFALACQPAPPVDSVDSSEAPSASSARPAPESRVDAPPEARRQAPASSSAPARAGGSQRHPRDHTGPLAYVNGEPIGREAMFGPMLEAAGGQVLAELLLDRMIRQQLQRRGIRMDDAALEAERQRVLESLSPDEDEAVRLLEELRQRRGLGEQRFHAFIHRNAALRELVSDRIEIEEDAVRHEYRLRHGERYRVRVLVVHSFDEASRLRRQALENPGAFSDLAATHSTDISADRGGLLSPISPADTSYPESLREVLPRLAERVEQGEQGHEGREGRAADRISDVIAVEGQFAVVKLEEKIEPEPVEFADVREGLVVEVRRRLERGHMRQLAREMLAEADVTVLDPALGRSWRQQRGLLLAP